MNRKKRPFLVRAQSGFAIETAIYIMAAVFILISTIMYVTVRMVYDDVSNNEFFIEKYSAADRVGEDFVAFMLYGQSFDPEQYPGFLVTVTEDTLLVKEQDSLAVLLTVCVKEGRILCWTR